MSQAKMQRGNLDAVQAKVLGRVTKQTLQLDGVCVTRVTYAPGARWSEDVKKHAGSDSCLLPHVALVLAGTFHVVMDDGTAQEFGKNDIMMLPPGHDAWAVGDEPCEFVEFSRGTDYYTEANRIRELIAVGAAVTANCQSCLEVRVGKARENGASDADIRLAVDAGTAVRRGAAGKFDAFAAGLLKNGPAKPCADGCDCR